MVWIRTVETVFVNYSRDSKNYDAWQLEFIFKVGRIEIEMDDDTWDLAFIPNIQCSNIIMTRCTLYAPKLKNLHLQKFTLISKMALSEVEVLGSI